MIVLFVFQIFVIVSLCNSSAVSWFFIISLLTAPPGNLFRVTRVAKASNRACVAEVLAP